MPRAGRPCAAPTTAAASSSTSGCRARTRRSSSPTHETEPMTDLLVARRRARRRPRSPARRSPAPWCGRAAWLAVLGVDAPPGCRSSGPTTCPAEGGTPVLSLVGVLRAQPGPGQRGRTLAAPRPDEPGRGRHGADAGRSRRGGCRRDGDARPGASARRAGRAAPRHPDGRAHPDPARGPDDVRAQGGDLALRRARRVRRPAALAFPVQVGGAAGTIAAARRAGGLDGRARRRPSRARRAASAWPSRRRGTPTGPPSPALGRRRRALHRRLGAHRQRRAHCWAAPRSASWPRAPAAARRRCRTRPTRCCRCWSVEPRCAHPQLAATLAPRGRRDQVDERPTAAGTPSGRRCWTLLRRSLVAAPRRQRPARPGSRCTRPDGGPPAADARRHRLGAARRWRRSPATTAGGDYLGEAGALVDGARSRAPPHPRGALVIPAVTAVRLTEPPGAQSCRCWCWARRSAPRPRRCGARAPRG